MQIKSLCVHVFEHHRCNENLSATNLHRRSKDKLFKVFCLTNINYYTLLQNFRDSNICFNFSACCSIPNILSFMVLYSSNGFLEGKKTQTPTSALGGTAFTTNNVVLPSASDTISISDFLQYVKSIPLVNEVFSKDVAKHLGVLGMSVICRRIFAILSHAKAVRGQVSRASNGNISAKKACPMRTS